MGQFQFGDKENKHPVGQITIGDFDQIFVGVDSFWPLQEETYGGVDPWFVGWEAYVSGPNCRQCQERT